MKELSKNLELLKKKEMEIKQKMNEQESKSYLNNNSNYSDKLNCTNAILSYNNSNYNKQDQFKSNYQQDAYIFSKANL